MGAAARRGRLTDTEAISFSLLLLLARSATHAEGVTLFCSLSTVHEKISHGRSKPLPYGLIYIHQNLWDDGLMLF